MNFSSFFDTAGRGSIPVIYLLCIFLALIFRPDHIRSLPLFRLSWIIFALYLLVPVLHTLVNSLTDPHPPAGRPNPAAQLEQMFGQRNVYVDVATQVLLLTSICFGLASLTPGLGSRRVAAAEVAE
jgi:hypothetical protein